MGVIDLNNMNTTKEGDEKFTPFYAVEHILKYLKPKSIIWCPFDEEWSAFVIRLREAGHRVKATHINQGKDFFNITPKKNTIDYIISNPPYTLKDKVLQRLYELNIPFAMLLPVATIQSMKRVPMFQKYGVEVLIFDGRTCYHEVNNLITTMAGPMFASAYFCKNVLPQSLIFESLIKTDRPLRSDQS